MRENIEMLLEMYPSSVEVEDLLYQVKSMISINEINNLRTNRVDTIVFDVVNLELVIIQLSKKEIVERITEYEVHDEIPFCVILSKTTVIIKEGITLIKEYL